MPTLTTINRNVSSTFDSLHQYSTCSKQIVVFFCVNMLLLFLAVELFGSDARSCMQCILVRKSETLDSSEALPRIVRLTTHERTSVAVPVLISSNCFEFYRPDGTPVTARERFASVNLAPPAINDFRVVSSNDNEDIDIRIDNDCKVRRINGGVIVESTFYEWRLPSGDYIIVVRRDSPTTVYSSGHPERSARAFGSNVRLVSIASSPILVRVP